MHPVFGSIDAAHLVAAVVLAAFLPLCWWLVWRLWRHGKYRISPGNPYSPQEQEMMLRLLPACVTGLTAMLLTVVVSGFLGQRTLAEKAAIGVLAIVWIGSFLVAVSVHFRGKPRWAIAPVLREREDRGEFRPSDARARAEGKVTLWDVVRARRRARERRRDYRRRNPSPTAWREGMPKGWLDPDSQEWVDRQWQEKHSDGGT